MQFESNYLCISVQEINNIHKFVFQSKTLRKLIQLHFKQYAQYAEHECVYKFFDTLKTVCKFEQERFRCALGVGIHYLTIYVWDRLCEQCKYRKHRFSHYCCTRIDDTINKGIYFKNFCVSFERFSLVEEKLNNIS